MTAATDNQWAPSLTFLPEAPPEDLSQARVYPNNAFCDFLIYDFARLHTGLCAALLARCSSVLAIFWKTSRFVLPPLTLLHSHFAHAQRD